jgi:hypothetical protein
VKSSRKRASPFLLIQPRSTSNDARGTGWPPPPPPDPTRRLVAVHYFRLADALDALDSSLFPAEWYGGAKMVLPDLPVVLMLDSLAHLGAELMRWRQPVWPSPMQFGVVSAIPRWGDNLLYRLRYESKLRARNPLQLPRNDLVQVHWRHARAIEALLQHRPWSVEPRPRETARATLFRTVAAAVNCLAFAAPPRQAGHRKPVFEQLDPRWHWLVYRYGRRH